MGRDYANLASASTVGAICGMLPERLRDILLIA
jgi:hypothetical protein